MRLRRAGKDASLGIKIKRSLRPSVRPRFGGLQSRERDSRGCYPPDVQLGCFLDLSDLSPTCFLSQRNSPASRC
jgi:hypothetical protein